MVENRIRLFDYMRKKKVICATNLIERWYIKYRIKTQSILLIDIDIFIYTYIYIFSLFYILLYYISYLIFSISYILLLLNINNAYIIIIY